MIHTVQYRYLFIARVLCSSSSPVLLAAKIGQLYNLQTPVNTGSYLFLVDYGGKWWALSTPNSPGSLSEWMWTLRTKAPNISHMLVIKSFEFLLGMNNFPKDAFWQPSLNFKMAAI